MCGSQRVDAPAQARELESAGKASGGPSSFW
jgi:hypothetical protein